ncbi:hypothetical protein KKG48_02200 [Patescibacteria group bacterium]|nr:hypothetical protein [Patescibacteria group bacterium]MCG2694733.1 hypothetical protein [Candidatus Parcubacteria bacterium]
MIDSFILSLPVMFQGLAANTLFVLYILAPFYIPFFLVIILWNIWVSYKRSAFILKQERILLEIKVPKEIKKTPMAAELFLNALHQTGGEGTWYDRNILGKSRTWFSLEMVSLGGQIKFFIWTEKRFKNIIEAQIYAQYPGVEVYEVPDYTKFVNFDLTNMSMWGNEFVLTKKIDAYPIKTYVDYGLNKEGLEDDEKSDPITPIIEFLGSIEKGEQLWIQIMVRGHKGGKSEWESAKSWVDMAKEEKLKLIESLKSEEEGKPPRLATKGEQDIIASIERNTDKLGFDCGIRGLYITEKEKFNPINITGITGTFKQFNSENLNGFKPSRGTGFDYPWQDYKNIRLNKMKKGIFEDYIRRAYFNYPRRSEKQFVLSSEELATIFHLPGGVAQTPTFSRITSKKAEPPIDLPF